MPLGICLFVDFAFQKSFGTPENAPALIGLLNAILDLPVPIDAVSILNPFSYQEFADDKRMVLDIRCRDATGRWFNVEMQVSPHRDMTKRLMYYASSMYADQLVAGQDYSQLTGAISICLLNKPLFRNTEKAHHRFEMVDLASGQQLGDSVVIHTVELSKYDIKEETIATKTILEKWVFLLRRAQDYDEAELRRLLPETEFQPAITTLATIAAKTEDRQLYDQREKALRDYEWGITGAKLEGREEGIDIGELTGTIRTLQELLGEPAASKAELKEKPIEELQTLADALKKRMTDRQV